MAVRQRKTQRIFTRRMIGQQAMIGPESGGIQFCLVCNRSILNGEHWKKVWAADRSYAVGVHDRCQSGNVVSGPEET